MNKDAFLRALFKSCHEHDWMDIDGGDLHELMLKHGFLIERLATEADCATEHGQEWELEVGTPSAFFTVEMIAFMGQEAEKR